MTSLEDEVDVHLDASLVSQLESIAAAHGGQVPIHGRLFAQWLHYVFPRDCAFPHKAGSVKAIAPMEFGKAFVATVDEMQQHASTANVSENVSKEELQWMSQWSAEEELISDSPAVG